MKTLSAFICLLAIASPLLAQLRNTPTWPLPDSIPDHVDPFHFTLYIPKDAFSLPQQELRTLLPNDTPSDLTCARCYEFGDDVPRLRLVVLHRPKHVTPSYIHQLSQTTDDRPNPFTVDGSSGRLYCEFERDEDSVRRKYFQFVAIGADGFVTLSASAPVDQFDIFAESIHRIAFTIRFDEGHTLMTALCRPDSEPPSSSGQLLTLTQLMASPGLLQLGGSLIAALAVIVARFFARTRPLTIASQAPGARIEQPLIHRSTPRAPRDLPRW